MEVVNDIDEPFVEKEWIGQDKKYDWEKLPGYITCARHEVMEIPPDFLSRSCLPKPNLSVTEFFSCELLRLSSEIISSKINVWFNADRPNIGYDVMISRPIPSADFINRLDAASGQAWIGGANSIVDHQYNDGRDRLPLWIISFWKEVAWC